MVFFESYALFCYFSLIAYIEKNHVYYYHLISPDTESVEKPVPPALVISANQQTSNQEPAS